MKMPESIWPGWIIAPFFLMGLFLAAFLLIRESRSCGYSIMTCVTGAMIVLSLVSFWNFKNSGKHGWAIRSELSLMLLLLLFIAWIIFPNFLRARAQGCLSPCKSNCRGKDMEASMVLSPAE